MAVPLPPRSSTCSAHPPGPLAAGGPGPRPGSQVRRRAGAWLAARRRRLPNLLLEPADLHGALAVSGVLSVLGLLATAAAFVLTARVIAAGLLQGHSPGVGTLLTVAALLLARAGAGAVREHLGTRLAARLVGTWRTRLSEAALRLGPVALADTRGADLATLDLDLVARLTPYYARYLPGAVHAALAFAVVLGVTVWLDPATAGVLLVTGPLTVVFLALVGLATGAATERQWLAHTRLSARLLTLVRHLPTLHAFGAVAPYRDVLARSARQHREATLGVLRVAFLSGFVMDFAATLATALVAVWIGVRLFGGSAELAPTLTALMLVPEFFGPLRQLGTDRHAALDAEPVAARLQDLLTRPVAPSGEGTVPAGVPHLSLSLARADLPTPTAPVSVELPPGTLAALRGPSGSGKTTLLHALRKHVPHLGSIRVDGTPLDDLGATWQARVAFVPQHPRLIAGSARDNLRLAAPDAGDADLERACEAVGLGDVLRALPSGFDTPLGEGGALLSGGETARLALARALLSGADVILLDEVSAHLDPESEAELHAVIERAFAGRTVLLATHRAVPPGWREISLGAPASPAVAA
ncbi:thiol reductant ABC exporter subunit CydD (plasmid) [Deinococcus metallilatus]|uniref:Thiol reductant ABC exporter subunit CydD n=1 Tax=Deinococcus metallilatus TaxID=1211322 RepID=A0AAJ5JZM7_9DEIO|nr:thiol reductant ABC exporter subunit CydD [Deinococcus metallilatus]RXJ14862.1 thiol reductant ABC exporter subunit CydD [Deinococcus metallilatus]TLK30983.1 thiol reductant ABC exporter subunit CydD [Deinococcus metallilatus]